MTVVDVQKQHDQALAAYNAGAFGRARDQWREILNQDPANPGALAGLMNSCHQLGDTLAPVALLEAAVAVAPDNEDVIKTYMDALTANQDQQRAIDLAHDAVKRFPHNSAFQIQVGKGWMGFGETDKARETLWAVHKADPRAIDPIFLLARIGDERDLNQIVTVADEAWRARETFEQPSRVMIAFTRAILAEKQGRYDEAWEAYATGNALLVRIAPFDEAGYREVVTQQLNLFRDAKFTPRSDNALGNNLVFILSLPRSGSTLTEQILASHSRVKAIGERPLMYYAFQIWNAERSPAAAERARAHYISGALALAGVENDPTTVIIDKSITNYVYLGFLRLLFPGARFVHVVRDPVDAAFSCFATPFGVSALKWCSDLGTIGREFRLYQKLMKTWMATDRGDLFTLAYEDLTAEPEARIRELLAFCGLEWEPACLAFHENKRQVSTASASQVRRPIYKTAHGRAAPFEAHLAPLRRVLGRAADPDWYLAKTQAR